jgi:WD40 repeat protein
MRILLCIALTFFAATAAAQEPKAPAPKPLRGHEGLAICAAVSPDGKLFAVGGQDGTVTLWDTATRKEVRSLTGSVGPVLAVAFDWKGEFVVAVGKDPGVRSWTIDGKEKFPLLQPEVKAPDDAKKAAAEIADVFTCVAVSPDGKLIVASGWDGKIRFWETDSRKETAQPSGQKAVFSLAFSPDGKWLAAGGRDGSVHIWEVAQKKDHATLPEHGRTVWALAWAADNKTLPASAGNAVKIWDYDGRKVTATLSGHAAAVRALAFADGSRKLVTGSEDRTVRVWDLEKRSELYTLTGPEGAVTGIAVTSDGRTILAVSNEKGQSARVWTLPKE